MKFGLESEKFLFDLKQNKPSEGVLRYLEALSDVMPLSNASGTITNEFVLNMAEIVTAPSTDPLEVIKSYLQHYELLNMVTQREFVSTVSLGSLPVKYQPHMIPKQKYFFQNSILNQRIEPSWIMNESSPLTAAGNCAGIHIHSEIETPLVDLYASRELQDKFNMGLMLTPMVAFSSSPYFFGKHEASSMRSYNYFSGVYRQFPLNGGLPPVMNSSVEVLRFVKMAEESWLSRGASIGLPEERLLRFIEEAGANWNPIRWNKKWNTIELRCLDSDRIDLDCAKFIWVTSAMKRLDLKGEALRCIPLKNSGPLNHSLIDKCFVVKDGDVSILYTEAIKELFHRATLIGIKDPFVSHYLERLADFAVKNLGDSKKLFEVLLYTLNQKDTTSEYMLKIFGTKSEIDHTDAVQYIHRALKEEQEKFKELTNMRSLSYIRIKNKDFFEPKALS